MGVAISVGFRLGAQIEDINVNSANRLLLLEVLFNNLVGNGVGNRGELGSETGRGGGGDLGF